MNNASVGNERTIHIRDLFITICQRWRSLIVCLIIGAVVLGAYGWWTSGNDTISSPEQAQMFGNRLGAERKGVIESYASDIYASTQQMIQQGQYNKESLLMKLDPFHLYVYELSYYINPAENDWSSSQQSAVAHSYLSKLQESFLGSKVTAVAEKDAYAEQIDYYESTYLIRVDKEDLENGILTFRLYYPQEQTDGVAELTDALQKAKGKVQSDLGKHDLVLIGESGFNYADLNILYIQESNAKRISDLADQIATLEKLVTVSDEQKYLDYLIAHPDTDTKGDTQKNTATTSKRHLDKKYIIIGAVLGLILAVIVIIIKYIASNAIRSTKEIEENFGLQILGSMEGNSPFYQKRKTKLDQWLRRKKNKTKDQLPAEEKAEVIATKIRIEAEKADLHNICLAVDKKVFEDAGVLETLVDKIGDVPSVKVIRNVSEQPDSLKGMAGMDGVVLVGQIDRSGFDDLKNICELCRSYSVKVIGSIIVE